MAKPTTTTTNQQNFEVEEFVLAQAPAPKPGEWFAHYPAVIKEVNETDVVCEWIDPKKRFRDNPRQKISTKNLLQWNYTNIDKVGNSEVPSGEKGYWSECAVFANRILRGKICLFRRARIQIIMTSLYIFTIYMS